MAQHSFQGNFILEESHFYTDSLDSQTDKKMV